MTANKRTPSTTSRWEWRKIRVPLGEPQDRAARSASSPALGRWNRREPLTITVVYRGGAEAWIEVRARGTVRRLPGSTCLFDALCALWDPPASSQNGR